MRDFSLFGHKVIGSSILEVKLVTIGKSTLDDQPTCCQTIHQNLLPFEKYFCAINLLAFSSVLVSIFVANF